MSMRIVCPEDCGNAPRKAQLRDFTIACARGALESNVELLSESVEWEIVGSQRLVGLDAVRGHLEDETVQRPVELRIHTIITHGNTAALNATLFEPNGTRVEVCDVYVFAGFGKRGKIKEVKSYRIKVSAS